MNGRATEYVGYMFPPNDDGIIEGAITLEPIVRCRDCKHCETILYKTLDNTDIADCRCTLHFTIDEEPFEVHSNGFCAWGEKR